MTRAGLMSRSLCRFTLRGLVFASFALAGTACGDDTSPVIREDLDQPKGLQATPAGPSSIRLSWSAIDPSYRMVEVERSAAGSTMSRIATVEASASRFEDKGLEPGVRYTYQIRVVDGPRRSPWTKQVSTSTKRASIPSKPTDLKVKPLSDTRIQLSWQDSSNDEDGFHVTRATGSGGFEHIRDLPPNTEQFVDLGLEAATRYSYRVTAFNAVGPSRFAEARAQTAASFDPQYEIDVSPVAYSGAYTVRLSSVGDLGSTSMFIEESTDIHFSSNVRRFDFSTGGNTVSRAFAGMATGTYYYRGGDRSSTHANLSEIKSITVNPQQDVRVYAQYDNGIMTGSSNTYDNVVFSNDTLGIGNDYWAGSFVSGWALHAALLRFDLEGFVGNANVAKATLRLTPYMVPVSPGAEYTVAAISEAWNPGSTSWSNAPSHFTTNITRAPAPSSDRLSYDLDVTPIVRGWINGGLENFGFVIFDDSPVQDMSASYGGASYFASLEYNVDPEHRPHLILKLN